MKGITKLNCPSLSTKNWCKGEKTHIYTKDEKTL